MNIKITAMLVVLGILLSPMYSYAQDAFTFPIMETVPSATTSEASLIFYSFQSEKSITTNSKWENGILYTTTNDVLYITARYIPEINQIQIKIKKNILTLFDSKVQACLIGEKTYVQSEYMDGIEEVSGYFELMGNGQIALLKQYNASTDNSTYYFTTQDEPAQIFKCKLKNILALFPSQKEAIKKYIKKNQLDIQDENNLAAVFKYANQLITPIEFHAKSVSN